MHDFNFKPLALYGVAISSVLLLFKTVTIYGENHLQAPPQISDRYHLLMSKNLPNCEKSQDLILNIQQSGIYVNAFLWSPNSNAKNHVINHHNNSLTGILRNQQLHVTGKIHRANLCKIHHPQDTSIHSATMRMQLTEKYIFTGQLTINSIPSILKFTARPNDK
ncbi:MAG: hypothetical protein KME23_10600 [Goleter apudmare HA4340-LM2]|jgi:hypothetical protein|nr:hypothetical protein [Goleter apudmare HA4340-LM2]